eukprot:4922508-Pyramimonas_sp.AAC.1
MLISNNASVRLLASDLAQAADSVLDLIEEDLDCSVALHKAAVLGSSAAVQHRLAKALFKRSGPEGVNQAQSAPNLGVDFTTGNRISKKARKTLAKRTSKMKRRLHRMA